jgi:hypothetical protein
MLHVAVERYNGDTKELEETDMMSFANSDGGRHKEVSGGKETLSGIRRLCATPSICCALLLAFQWAADGAIPAGHVASHGLERDMVNADGTGQGAGYFTFIEGIPGPLFVSLPSETTAFFTFTTATFSTISIPNGNVTALIHPPGNFYVYLNPMPNGNWNDFTSFAQGQLIATLNFGTTQDVSTGVVQTGYTSASLVASSAFDFRGRRFNFSDLFPHGVTIAFTVNPKPLNTGFPLIFSLGFTSFAIGAKTNQTE